jgi:hypothetical protein
MATILASLMLVLQEIETEPVDNWWTSWIVGEWVGKDWLLFAGGVVFFGLASYGAYAAMIYNMVGSNYHPANFRRVIIAFFLLLSIIWFIWVFAHAFGGPVAFILVGVCLALCVVLLLTRRRVAQAQ